MSVICLGRFLIDFVAHDLRRLPPRFSAQRLPAIQLSPGGGGATTAAMLGRLGHNVNAVGAVGDDWEGRFLTEQLVQRGVDTAQLSVIHDAETAKAIVAVDEEGAARHAYAEGADLEIGRILSKVGPDDSPSYIHIANFNLFVDDSGQPLRDWLEETRRRNPHVIVCVDASKTLSAARRFQSVAPLVDYYFANYYEAERATGGELLRDISQRAFDSGVLRGVVIKLGNMGVYWRTRREEEHLEGFRVPVRNVNGAGDVFCAGVLHGLIKGETLATGVEYANVLAATQVMYANGIVYAREPVEHLVENADVKTQSRSGAVFMDAPYVEYWPGTKGFSTSFHLSRRMSPRNIQWWIHAIREHGKVDRDSKVLDGGCGIGRFAGPLQDLVRCNVVGVDKIPEMLNFAARNCPGPRWVEADLEQLDVKLGGELRSFDCVWLSSVLPQIREPADLFGQMNQALKPDGRLLLRMTPPEVLDEVEWYRFFPAALDFEKKYQRALGLVLRFLSGAGFVVTHVEFRTDVEAMPSEDLIERFRAGGFVWRHLYDDEEYEQALKEMANFYSLHGTVEYQQPAYLVVARKRA